MHWKSTFKKANGCIDWQYAQHQRFSFVFFAIMSFWRGNTVKYLSFWGRSSTGAAYGCLHTDIF
jgi:hypothetical protein